MFLCSWKIVRNTLCFQVRNVLILSSYQWCFDLKHLKTNYAIVKNSKQSVQVHFMLFQSNPFLFLSILQPEQTLTSIVIYPLYHHVTGTIHQGEINWLLSTNGRTPQTQEKAFNNFHSFISQVLQKLLFLGCASGL